MPLIQCKCENCGGNLEADISLKTATCPHCGTTYLVRDIINIALSGKDETLESADAFLKLGETDNAMNLYEQVSSRKPQEYRAWLGLIKCYARKYSDAYVGECRLTITGNEGMAKCAQLLNGLENEMGVVNDALGCCRQYYSKFEVFAPQSEISSAKALWNGLEHNLNRAKDELIESIANVRAVRHKREKELNAQIAEIDARIEGIRKEIEAKEKIQKDKRVKEYKWTMLDSYFYNDIDSGYIRPFYIWLFYTFLIGSISIVILHFGIKPSWASVESYSIIAGCESAFIFLFGVFWDIRRNVLLKRINKASERESAIGKEIFALRTKIRELDNERAGLVRKINEGKSRKER